MENRTTDESFEQVKIYNVKSLFSDLDKQFMHTQEGTIDKLLPSKFLLAVGNLYGHFITENDKPTWFVLADSSDTNYDNPAESLALLMNTYYENGAAGEYLLNETDHFTMGPFSPPTLEDLESKGIILPPEDDE